MAQWRLAAESSSNLRHMPAMTFDGGDIDAAQSHVEAQDSHNYMQQQSTAGSLCIHITNGERAAPQSNSV